jgi:WD40 repeat protein
MIELYDAQSGKLVRGFPRRKRNVSDLAFSPDGRILAIVSGDLSGAQIDLWELTAQAPARTLTDHEKGITAISFSPHGGLLASGELRNGRGIVVVRDLTVKGQPQSYKVDAGVSTLSFSSGATRLAVGTDKGQINVVSLVVRSSQP